MAAPRKVAPGYTLDGRFLFVDRIGHGGMSTVWKARDLENDGHWVAVKVPLPEYSSGTGSWSMFQREEEIGRQLDHPYIVRFLPLPPDRNRNHVVTEYVEGTTLVARVGKGRFIDESEALGIASRLCDAVAYLHAKGIVHYDLKPGNVMLCADGSIRLIDFGMAHPIVTSRFALGSAAPAFATAEYVAPEQLRRKRGRPSVDIYALGAMLYEMLTGHPPFEGDDPFVVASARQLGDPKAPREIRPAISVAAEEIVLRALRRKPKERYETVAKLKADLDRPFDVKVSGLSSRLVTVTRGRKVLTWIRYVSVVGVGPIAFLLVSFRLLWWCLERKR